MTTNLPKPVQRQLEQAQTLLEATATAAAPEPAADAPQAAVTETPAPPAEAQQAPAQDPDAWERRYKTLQGITRTNAEDFKRRMSEREAEIQQLRSALESARNAPPPAPTTNTNDAETFGEDLVAMVHRVATSTLGGTVTNLVQRLEALENALQGTRQTVTQTAEEMFFAQLGARVPNYREINAETAFLEWLGEVDPVYGTPRQSALDAACRALDADRAARVFQAFLATKPAPAAPSVRPAAPPLSGQIAPRASGGAPTPVDRAPQVITTQQVEQFYRDVARGAYRGREQQAASLEQQINQALAQGRIVERAPHHAIA